MSSIGPGIAASVTQGIVQQGQVARANDAVRNKDEQEAQRLRRLIEQHTHEVEDSAETDPNRLRIHEEPHDADQRRKRRQAQQDYRDVANQAEPQADASQTDPGPPQGKPDDGEPPLYQHLDIEA